MIRRGTKEWSMADDVDAKLRRVTAKAQNAWKEYQQADPDPVLEYLGAVYSTVSGMPKAKRTRYLRRALELAQKQPSRELGDPYAAFIFCTSDETKVDGKLRSKWSRALRFVEYWNQAPKKEFRKFVAEYGGINGCATEWVRCSK
jgi:hypothetical protein